MMSACARDGSWYGIIGIEAGVARLLSSMMYGSGGGADDVVDILVA